jgi:hypothetical protein
VQNSNGKPNNWVTNLSPSNPRPHNEPVQRAGVSWKLQCTAPYFFTRRLLWQRSRQEKPQCGGVLQWLPHWFRRPVGRDRASLTFTDTQASGRRSPRARSNVPRRHSVCSLQHSKRKAARRRQSFPNPRASRSFPTVSSARVEAHPDAPPCSSPTPSAIS